MENYAKRIAIEHNVQGRVSKKSYPIKLLNRDFEIIKKAYDILTESITLNISIPPSGEWLLDNFYVIEEQVNNIKKELKYSYYKELPAVKGKSRIFIIAEELVEFTDGNITKESIEKFISSYETKRKISMKEIYIIPIMLKISLIKKVSKVSERIISSQLQKFKVASVIERLIKNKEPNNQEFAKYRSINLEGEISSYVEFMVYLLKKEGKTAKKYIDILSEEIKKAGTTVDEIIKIEHYDMALRRMSIGNCITSLKNILRYNWNDIFEKIDGIENILLEDEWYRKSDEDTKHLYKNEIQKISKKTKMSETYIASECVQISKKNSSNVGEYLIRKKQNRTT